MSTMSASLPLSPRRELIAGVWRRNPPLVALVLSMLVVAAVALLGLVVDPGSLSVRPRG